MSQFMSPEAAYLSKDNIRHPGTSAQVTAAITKARTDIAERIPAKGGSAVTVSNGTIKAHNEANWSGV